MNKNIFITGGTSGIGNALINEFAKNNYNIFFTYYKNFNQAKLISKELNKFNIQHAFTKMDLGKSSSIQNAFREFRSHFNELNIFISNASPKVSRESFLKLKNEDIFKNINALLAGNIVAIKNALEILSKKKNSRAFIINISSYSSISGGKNIHLYAAAKSALNTLCKALSKDKYKKKIKIFSILPKYIDTPAFRKNNNIKNKIDLRNFIKSKRIKNIKTSSQFARLIYKKI